MTIVNRRTFIAKRGCYEEVVSMLKGERGADIVSRVYRSHYGPFDTVALEVEFESVEAMERGWAEWSASPGSEQFMKRWVEVTEPGGANEVWILEP